MSGFSLSVRCRAWLQAHLPSTQILALSTLPSQRRLQGSPLGNQRQRDICPEEPLFSGAGGIISNSLLLQDTACPLRRGGVLSDFPDNIWKKRKSQAPKPKDNFNPPLTEPKVNQRSHRQSWSAPSRLPLLLQTPIVGIQAPKGSPVGSKANWAPELVKWCEVPVGAQR